MQITTESRIEAESIIVARVSLSEVLRNLCRSTRGIFPVRRISNGVNAINFAIETIQTT